MWSCYILKQFSCNSCSHYLKKASKCKTADGALISSLQLFYSFNQDYTVSKMGYCWAIFPIKMKWFPRLPPYSQRKLRIIWDYNPTVVFNIWGHHFFAYHPVSPSPAYINDIHTRQRNTKTDLEIKKHILLIIKANTSLNFWQSSIATIVIEDCQNFSVIFWSQGWSYDGGSEFLSDHNTLDYMNNYILFHLNSMVISSSLLWEKCLLNVTGISNSWFGQFSLSLHKQELILYWSLGGIFWSHCP